jgi:hypothetical protein
MSSGSIQVPLPNAPEGTGTVQFQYRTDNGMLSPLYSVQYFVDGVAPSVPTISNAAATSDTGTVTVAWAASTDTGAGLDPAGGYSYEVASDSGFTAVTQSGTTDLTQIDLSLPDGRNFVRVRAVDAAGNQSVPSTYSVLVDTVAPDAPSVFEVNEWQIVSPFDVSAVPFAGMAGTGETASVAYLDLSDNQG